MTDGEYAGGDRHELGDESQGSGGKDTGEEGGGGEEDNGDSEKGRRGSGEEAGGDRREDQVED